MPAARFPVEEPSHILLLQHGMAEPDCGSDPQPDRSLAEYLRRKFCRQRHNPAHPLRQSAFSQLGRAIYRRWQVLSTCDAPVRSPLLFRSGNAIPASLLDPNAQALLRPASSRLPPAARNSMGGNKFTDDVREEIARVDHQFTDKFSIFGHWISEQISQGFGTTQWSGDNVPTVGNTFGNPSYSARGPHHLYHQPEAAERSVVQLQRQPHQHYSRRVWSRPYRFHFTGCSRAEASSRIPTIN